jgi:hypothetical protein
MTAGERRLLELLAEPQRRDRLAPARARLPTHGYPRRHRRQACDRSCTATGKKQTTEEAPARRMEAGLGGLGLLRANRSVILRTVWPGVNSGNYRYRQAERAIGSHLVGPSPPRPRSIRLVRRSHWATDLVNSACISSSVATCSAGAPAPGV